MRSKGHPGIILSLGLVTIALLFVLSSCSDGNKEEIRKITFARITAEGETPEETYTMAEISVSAEESMTIPTIREQLYTPEIELAFFNNIGLISDAVQIGNLRDQPSMNGNIVGRFYPNTGMEILEDMGNGWLRISSGGIEGYVSQSLVLGGEDAISQAMRYGNYWLRINVDALNVRMEPSTDTGIVARVILGQTYPVIGREGEWYKISVGEEEGYIHRDYCQVGYTVAQAENWNQLANLSGPAYDMVAWGMQYLGLPYIYGGESMSSGCDCSYFSCMCMSRVGIGIRRTSREQAQQGAGVGSMAEALPGDLLFYATHGTIDHVAVYIGDGKILHAAQSIGCVSISAYNYCGEPVAIRRYF